MQRSRGCLKASKQKLPVDVDILKLMNGGLLLLVCNSCIEEDQFFNVFQSFVKDFE